MVKTVSGQGLLVAGASLLLIATGIALAGTVKAVSAPPGPDLGPPVVVRDVTVNPTIPGTDGTSGNAGAGPTAVAPAPAHETDSDDEDETEYPHG